MPIAFLLPVPKHIVSNTQVRSHHLKVITIRIRQEMTILLLSSTLANKHISFILAFNYRTFSRKHHQEINNHVIFIIQRVLNVDFIRVEFNS